MGHVDNYVVLINSKRDCDVLLRILRRSSTWNARAKFLIVAKFTHENQTEFVAHILSSFWKQYAINIVVLVANDHSKKVTTVQYFIRRIIYFC